MRRCRAAALTALLLLLPAAGLSAADRTGGIGRPVDFHKLPSADKSKGGPASDDLATPANAAPTAPTGAHGKNDPALLTADELTSDESLGQVIARGHVELSQGGRTVQADTLTYNQKTKVVIAAGAVKLFEPTGEVMFSDYAELTDDLRDAFVNNVRMIMSDNSRATGTEAERTDGRYTRINHATYSACYLCQRDPNEPPVWQLRSAKAVHDNVDKDVRYKDAQLEILGTPVFYSPYFSHPDPTVKRRSGFLMPTTGSNSNLGAFFRDSYYLDIAPDLDATFESTAYSKQYPMLGAEVRKRWETGALQLAGTITHSSYTPYSTLGVPGQSQSSWRGFLEGSALFDVSDAWRVGGNLNVASDQNFLRTYYDARDNLLISRGFAEGFWGRDYAAIEAYRFQDLREGNPQIAPVVAPMVQYTLVGEPNSLLGGRWTLGTGMVGLTRSSGPDSTRVALEPGWAREWVFNNGLVTTANLRARTDVWHYQDYLPPGFASTALGQARRGADYRFLPQGQLKFAYPFVRNGESTQQVLEPLVALTAAPRVSNRITYPNEDSRDIELDETSLFMFNRFVGHDRQEGGQRVTYGLRSSLVGLNEGRGSLFLGQDYRLSNDQPFTTGSGLEHRRSDYVGKLEVLPASWLYLGYGFSNDSQSLEPRRETVGATVGVPAFRLSGYYRYDRDAPNPNPDISLLHREESINYGISSQLSRYWSTTASLTEAIAPDPGLRSSGLMFSYADECLVFQTIAALDFTSPNGSGQSQSIYFRLVFKNIGEFTSPGFSPSAVFGSRSSSTNTTSSSTNLTTIH